MADLDEKTSPVEGAAGSGEFAGRLGGTSIPDSLIIDDARLLRPDLGARYVVQELLGSGGRASVWRARDEKLGREVAVKVLHRHLQPARATREQLQREAVIAASLVHENLIQVYDYASQESAQSYIAMELVDGQQLRTFLKKAGPLPTVAALLIGNELARGLAFAHARQVIHRDLKPENVMVSRTGAVKIADFGIAGVEEKVRLTRAATAQGSPAYLSPEQVRGEAASTRSDVFALGVMLYEMAAGKGPFESESSTATMYRVAEDAYVPPERYPTVDPDLAALIRRCLSRDPQQRPADAGELSVELAAMLQRREVGDPRAQLARYFAGGPLPKTRAIAAGQRAIGAHAKRLRMIWAVSAVALVAAAAAAGVTVGVGGGAIASGSRDSRRPEAKPAASAEARSDARAAAGPAVPGTLKLSVSGEWTDVDILVDGVKLGRYPIERSFALPEGGHLLELTGNAGRAPYRAQVSIEAGKTVEHRAELLPTSAD